MTQTLLVVLDRAETAATVLRMAGLAAARLGDTRIVALHLRHDPMEGFMPTEEVMSPQEQQARTAAEAEKSTAIRAIFDAWRSASGNGEWREVVGETATVVAEQAAGTDAIVIGHAPGAERDERDAMNVALFEARLPTLFVPAGVSPVIGRRIAIAWKPSPAADRAIAAAMPLLLKAEQVTVLIGAESGLGKVGLEHQLAAAEQAGVSVAVAQFALADRPIGAALIEEAHKAGADLLVMGAFTHSRWSEFILGGATRHILAEADLPVLMQH